jgi:hypothetical protein
MNYEDYTKTEDANGVITFTPKPKQVPDGAYWEPKVGERYFCISTEGDAWASENTRHSIDKERIALGNCFRTQELVEKENQQRKALTRVRKFIAENGLYWEPDWSNGDQTKYFLRFDFRSNTFGSDCWFDLKQFSPIGCFKSIEDVEKIITACDADLRIMWDVK